MYKSAYKENPKVVFGPTRKSFSTIYQATGIILKSVSLYIHVFVYVVYSVCKLTFSPNGELDYHS